MSEREPIIVIAQVIQQELGIEDGHIMLAYEKWKIPEDKGLYVALSYLGAKAIGNNNYAIFDDTLEKLMEYQEVTMRYEIQIDAMSFDASARIKQEQIHMALRSVYAQQAMEQNLMQIARMPAGFINASSLEETKILNRFTTMIAVTALQQKIKPVTSYYDEFRNPEVHVNV